LSTSYPASFGRRPSGPFKVPKKDENDPAVWASFFSRVCNHQSNARREAEFEWYGNKLNYESVQWWDILSSDAGRSIRMVEQEEDEEDIPQTTNNELLPIIDTHRSRLGKRRSRGYVRARRADNANAKIAATKGDDVLDATLDEDRWDATYREHVFSNVLYGTGIFSAEWLKDIRKSTRIGLQTAVKCPTCTDKPFVLADKAIDPQMFMKLAPSIRGGVTVGSDFGLEGVSQSFSVDHCLRCGAPMMPYSPPIGPETDAKDLFGREMGEDVPLGDTHVRVPSLFNFFVENDGVMLRPGPMGRPGCPNWYAEDGAESLDNIGCWYKKGDQVKPESPEEIARGNQVMGEHGPQSRGWRDVANRNLWAHHSRLFRFVQGPTRESPLGRYVAYANKTVLMNGDLLVKCEDEPGLLVPLVTISASRFFPKKDEFFGQGVATGMWSQQRRINMSWAQITDNRERSGVDAIMLPAGGRLESRGWVEGYPGRVVYWAPDPKNKDDKPIPLPARLADVNAYKEIEFQIQRMQNFSGLYDQDVGNLSGAKVLSGTAIQLAGDKSSQRGEMRDAELVDACKESWSAILKLKRRFVRESRKYWVKGVGQAWQEQEYRGADLAGQTDVLVDEQPHFDKKAFDREMTVKAIDLRLLPIDTAYARREARRELGVQNNVADMEARQLDDAENKWHSFAKSREVPSIEVNEDAHKTYWEVYGLGWKSEEGLEIKQGCAWDKVLPVLAGWEKDFQQQKQRELQFEQLVLSGRFAQAQQMAAAGAPPAVPAPPKTLTDPVVAAEAEGAQAMAQQQAASAYQTAQSVVSEWAQYEPPPQAYELHILQIWTARLSAKAVQLEEDGPLLPVLKMKAVGEAHYLYANERAMAAAAGQPAVAAPADEQTPGGTEPDPTVQQQQ